MSLEAIVSLIPASYRKEILELNLIDTAIARADNGDMNYLATIWQQYVEKDFDPSCNLCYSRVLQNFKNLKLVMIQMEKNDKMLSEL